jgi:DNA-binding MarR family transcriptional regulator
LRRFEITPARFDALYVIRWRGGSCYQSEIWQDLDLHPSTISRMLKSMEQRGLVARERARGKLIDAREVVVTLTRKGFDTIVGAIKAFLREDDLRDFYNRMHEKGVEHIKGMVASVRNIGEWLRDFAKHPYSAERPDVAGGERYDAEVQKEVDRMEKIRASKAEGLRGLAEIAPEDNPTHWEYWFHPKNTALKNSDRAAFRAKVLRDAERHDHFYELAYLCGVPDAEAG